MIKIAILICQNRSNNNKINNHKLIVIISTAKIKIKKSLQSTENIKKMHISSINDFKLYKIIYLLKFDIYIFTYYNIFYFINIYFFCIPIKYINKSIISIPIRMCFLQTEKY